MIIKETNGVKYCVFENIEKTGIVSHCFSTRKGGVSEGIFDSLNVSYTRGDKKENVDENIKRICSAIGVSAENIVCGHQVHGNKILKIFKSDMGRKGITDYDGFITNEKGIVLSTFHADCVPIFMVDTQNRAIAMVHSGWRGTAKKIAAQAIEKMKEEYGTRAENIAAAIGPSIGMCCFQVDMPVVAAMREAFDFADEFIKKDETSKDHFKADLWGINKRLLEECGVKNIEVTDKCTMCNEDLFYSHRRMGNERGSMAAYICLK